MKFKDEEQKRDTIIAALVQLTDNLGWKVIAKVLQENIEITEGKLHGDVKWDKGDTIEGLQDKRNDRIRLLNLPKDLVEEYKDVEQFPPDLDPYE